MKKVILICVVCLFLLACVSPDVVICPDSNGDLGMRIRSDAVYLTSNGDSGQGPAMVYGLDMDDWFELDGVRFQVDEQTMFECYYLVPDSQPVCEPDRNEVANPDPLQQMIDAILERLYLRFGGLR